MPPQHPQGDVLDRALAVARSQAPAKVPGQTGFFNALKPNSTAFAQTARVNVTKPAAQRKQQARVVPAYTPPAPAVTTPAAKTPVNPFHSFGSTIPAPVKRVAAALGSQASPTNLVREAANPAFGNPIFGKGAALANEATTKGLAALGRINVGSQAATPGDASTSAGILNAAKNLPVASLQGERDKIIKAMAFFAKNPSYKYEVPNLGVYNQQDKTKLGLPPTATDADVIRKEYQPFTGHRDFVESLVHNIPLNTAQLVSAPVGIAYLASQSAQGKTGAAKEFAREQVDFGRNLVEHPLQTLKTDPVGVATTAFGVGRLAGGLGGTLARTGIAGDAAKAFATPAERLVKPAGFGVEDAEHYPVEAPAISRGLTSPKLDERVAQAASDWAARNLKSAGKRLVSKSVQDVTRVGNRESNDLQAAEVTPALKAASKISPTERRAVTYAHGQGVKPSEMADYFTKQAADHRALEQASKDTVDSKGRNSHPTWQSVQTDLDNAATLWTKVAKKQGDTLSSNAQTALTTASQASRSAEAQMTAQHLPGSTEPLLQPETLARRAYLPLARVRGVDPEDAAAMQALRTEHRASVEAPPVEPGAPLDVHDPLYFPHVIEGPRGLAKIKRGQGLGISSENIKPRYAGRLGKAGQSSSGELFAQGRASSDPSAFFGAIAKPAKIASALKHLQDQVSNFSIHAEPGMRYDTNNWIRLDTTKGGNVTNVHTTSDADKAIKEASDTSLKDQLFSHFKDEPKGITAEVPKDGHDYVLVSRAGHKALQNDFNGYDSKTLKALKNTTAAWRWATLMARPAWLVNNVAGNAAQAALAGAGPGDLYRAARPEKFPVPSGVENAGNFANTFDRTQGVGSKLAHPIHAFTNVVVEANVKSENFFRRAVALHNLSSEAKAAANGEFRTIRSGYHRSTDATKAYLKNPTPEAAARTVKEVNRTMGDFTRLKQTPIKDVISPFHKWFAFIGKLTATMPVKTPGRALLLQRLGQFGINVQSQAFGGFVPNSLQGSLQLPASLPLVGGLYKSTQGLNPFATAFQMLAPNDQSTTDPGQPNFQSLLSGLNPAFGALWNAGAGTDFQTGATLKDQYGNPTGHGNVNVLGHELENSLPFMSLLSGYNTADTSLNPISPDKTTPGKYTQAPSSFLDRALGYGLGSVRPFDPTLNQVSSFKRLVPALKTEAKNRAKHGG